ncbi:MAG: hypothetical protein K2L37_05625 [Lactobacillus sp.]|nr:hypothetical protein [Lactobacillus sp.]
MEDKHMEQLQQENEQLKRKKLFELINLALDIQERRKGVDGYPYVSVEISNYGHNIQIMVSDDGFQANAPFDGWYEFDFEEEISQSRYDTCIKHLEELKAKAEGICQELSERCTGCGCVLSGDDYLVTAEGEKLCNHCLDDNGR